jgi:hypothetical protein
MKTSNPSTDTAKGRALKRWPYAQCIGANKQWDVVTIGATVGDSFQVTDTLHGTGTSPRKAWEDAARKLK